jgi:hypothetical protein
VGFTFFALKNYLEAQKYYKIADYHAESILLPLKKANKLFYVRMMAIEMEVMLYTTSLGSAGEILKKINDLEAIMDDKGFELDR